MPAQKVEAIRLNNNNITVARVFSDENNDSAQNSADYDIPNPIETFEQCFDDYPELLGKQLENLINFQGL